MVTGLTRRVWLVAALPAATVGALAGCAEALLPPQPPSAPPPAEPPAGPATLTPWRTIQGGFLAPPMPGVGLPPKPPSGMFVRFMQPGALALRGQDLLVADVGAGRLWRADTFTQSVTGIAGAPVMAGTALALGIDLSAWVLDPGSRQVLRFARDGRLLQTWRAPASLANPVAFALADNGTTLLLGDGPGAGWAELRGASGIATPVLPVTETGARIGGVDGLAVARDGSVFALDRRAGAVHRVARDGRVLETLGAGELKQPAAIAVDRFDRVWVLETFGAGLRVLARGRAPERIATAPLGVQRVAALAADDRFVALADAVTGNVVVLQTGVGGAR